MVYPHYQRTGIVIYQQMITQIKFLCQKIYLNEHSDLIQWTKRLKESKLCMIIISSMTNDSSNMRESVLSMAKLNEFCEEKLLSFKNSYLFLIALLMMLLLTFPSFFITSKLIQYFECKSNKTVNIRISINIC